MMALFIGKPHVTEYLAERAANSVVFVSIDGPSQRGSCSGEVVAHNRVLTAHHCIGEKMWADGKPAKVLSSDEYFDLALLSVDTGDRPFISLSDHGIERGDNLIGIGYAFGWDQLSFIHLRVTLANIIPDPQISPRIATEGEVIMGMSGGPVVDSMGRMVSIVQLGAENLSMGVSVPIIRAFLLQTDVR
jgi:S1-C subfamily serine protease